jgi:hypothetical protein
MLLTKRGGDYFAILAKERLILEEIEALHSEMDRDMSTATSAKAPSLRKVHPSIYLLRLLRICNVSIFQEA